jgi:thioredoxin-related protein
MKNSIYALTGVMVFILLFSCNSPTPEEGNKPFQVEATTSIAKQNRLEVYCFHGTRQCETCKNMKANTKTALDKYFASQLKDSSIVFSIIDVDDEKNEKLAEKFQATGTALMINKVMNGKDSIIDWSDFAFEKANDSEVFISELKTRIETALKE